MTVGGLRLAVLGDPLSYTLSPALHRAGLSSVGMEGTSEALRTPIESLGERLRELGARGYRGLNLTVPLKQAALAHLDWVSEPARRSQSVNTVSFDAHRWHGETTDGPGFVDLLGSLGRSVAHERVVLLGGGGAARSIALGLAANGGAGVTASVRDPGAAAVAWREIPNATLVRWRSPVEAEALARATLVVNATPLGEKEEPVALERITPKTLVIDLRYREALTPWISNARARGLVAYDGLGLLVFQARRSLELWTGCEVPVDPLARAVGWPR